MADPSLLDKQVKRKRTPEEIRIAVLTLVEEKGGIVEIFHPKSFFTLRCCDGHTWNARLTDLEKGVWCPRCVRWRREESCRLILENIYKSEFPKSSPQWLKYGRSRFQLDGYNAGLCLAFEYQGEQHYRDVSYFRNEGGLERRKENDARKEWLCRRNGVLLLVIPYWVFNDNLPEWIERRLASLGAPLSECNSEMVYPINSIARSRLQKLKDVASRRKGACLDTVYKGRDEKQKFQCQRGHVWEAFGYTIERGQWCPECFNEVNGKHRRLTIDDMREIASFKGGKCLSVVYENNKTKLEWECAKGHRWWADSSGVRNRRSWCPTCGRKAGGPCPHPTIQELQQIAARQRGECLSSEYVNSKTKLRWRCEHGHIWWASPSNVKNRLSWCPICADLQRAVGRRLGIDAMRDIAKVRGGKCLSEFYTHGHDRLHWMCADGHEWWARPNSIVRGTWCPKCIQSVRRGTPFGQSLRAALYLRLRNDEP